MSKASDLWNSMPKEYRLKARPTVVETQILQLKREKERLRRSYKRSVKEIDEHINSLEIRLAEYVADEGGPEDG